MHPAQRASAATRRARRALQVQVRGQPENFIPEALFIAFGPDGTVAGFCRAEFEMYGAERLKVVDGPGVVPEHRSQYLQRPLALAAMRWLNTRQPGPVALYAWGDSEKTIEIYREMGFVVQEHHIEYKRDLKSTI